MAKATINVGSNANDGTGDDLRSAFISVNANFTELYDASPATSSISIEGNTGKSGFSNEGTFCVMKKTNKSKHDGYVIPKPKGHWNDPFST